MNALHPRLHKDDDTCTVFNEGLDWLPHHNPCVTTPNEFRFDEVVRRVYIMALGRELPNRD